MGEGKREERQSWGEGCLLAPRRIDAPCFLITEIHSYEDKIMTEKCLIVYGVEKNSKKEPGVTISFRLLYM